VKQIQQSKVLLIGAGSVGCEVLKNLTALKVAAGSGGEILVADKGKVNASHMCSQMLYRSIDVGVSLQSVVLITGCPNDLSQKSKADLAVERIGQLSSVKSNITPWVTNLDSREKEEFSRYDVVINASPARYGLDDVIQFFQ
jgi:molybdopterin/thiamine biosynthesis adenylyltransferase